MRSGVSVAAIAGAAIGLTGAALAQAPAQPPPLAPNATRPAPPSRAAAPAAPQAPRAAQVPAAQPAEVQKSSSVTAMLYRVDGGLFDLYRGQSIDLTDRKVLLTITLDQQTNLAEAKQLLLSINGIRISLVPGQRFDFKSGSYSSLAKIFSDKTACYIDLIDVAVPKGAQPVATFRFECE